MMNPSLLLSLFGGGPGTGDGQPSLLTRLSDSQQQRDLLLEESGKAEQMKALFSEAMEQAQGKAMPGQAGNGKAAGQRLPAQLQGEQANHFEALAAEIASMIEAQGGQSGAIAGMMTATYTVSEVVMFQESHTAGVAVAPGIDAGANTSKLPADQTTDERGESLLAGYVQTLEMMVARVERVGLQSGATPPPEAVNSLSFAGGSGGGEMASRWLSQDDSQFSRQWREMTRIGSQLLQQVQHGATNLAMGENTAQGALMASAPPPRSLFHAASYRASYSTEQGAGEEGRFFASARMEMLMTGQAMGSGVAPDGPSITQTTATPPESQAIASMLQERLGGFSPRSDATTGSAAADEVTTTSSQAKSQANGEPSLLSLTQDQGSRLLQDPAFLRFMSAEPSRGQLPVTQQVSVQILQARAKGENEVTIRLRPPELGRVEVKMQVDSEQNAVVRIMTETREAYELLRADRAGLERILQESGMQTSDSGLEFSFQGEQGEFTDDQDADTGLNGSQGLSGEEEGASDDAQAAPPATEMALSVTTGVNITV